MKVIHDKYFFYHFMFTRGYRGAEIEYFWNIFISGDEYHNWGDVLGKEGIKALDVFDRTYGEHYIKEKYKVEFDFKNDHGDWVRTEYDNNGEGYSSQDASDIKRQLIQNGMKNVKMILIKEGSWNT